MTALVWHPSYVVPLRPGHRMPMSKYGHLHALLAAEGLLGPDPPAPGLAPASMLAAVHDPGYVGRVLGGTLRPEEIRRIGLPGSAAVAERARRSAAGTLAAARIALGRGFAANLAGGSHHAGPEGGAGFCVFNDVAVAARALLDEAAVERVLVVDLDVHQGDGTARIFATEPRVFTLSIHAARNFPARKARSSLDVALPDATGDGPYLAALGAALDRALAAGPFDLAFLNAGVDTWAGDRLGRLALSLDGLARRERETLARLTDAGLPVVAVLGGGYGHDPAEVAGRHALMFRAAAGLGLLPRGPA